VRTCPNCGEDNPDRARFCLSCATPLDRMPTGPGDERKVVSVLFVDLVGFTETSESADPEDVRARLSAYHGLLRREIQRFGGTVEKFIGDAVMAVFGAPTAHEDDAERAVRAALRILDAIEELNEDHPGFDLAIRAAVNTGEAMVALSARPETGEGLVAGDVVNTASRLQGIAPAGAVVVAEPTYRATRETVDYEALDAVRVKGKANPVPVWRATAARSRYGIDTARPRTPFVGRQDDLAMLRQAYLRAIRERSMEVVTVVGEPGAGKSRLVAEYQAWVDDRPELVAWRQGRCLPYGEGITFWALGEIVKAQAGILESDAPSEARRKLNESVAHVADESDREWFSHRLAPLVGLPSDAQGNVDQVESFTAWAAFLEAVATERPLVLIVEDLHWADPALAEFLDALVDRVSDVPMILVCTARPELFERLPAWGGGKRDAISISLRPLSPETTARLLSVLLDQAVLPAGMQAQLLERAGGNPLFAEEFVRMLVDTGWLQRQGEAWVPVANGPIAIPESLQALIAARLDLLRPDRKAVLQDASVIGKVFWAGAVAAVGRRDEREATEVLRAASRKGIVRPVRRSSVEGQSEYAFWHLLVRDVAYGQIPRPTRAVKHRAAAEWIEAMAGERVADQAELLAYHYEQALDLARATGAIDDVPALEEQLVRFLELAGDRGLSLDLRKAESSYRRALDLLSPDSPARSRLLQKLAIPVWLLGRNEEATRAAEEAVRLADVAGDREAMASALVTLSSTAWQTGQSERAREVAYQAIEILEALPPSATLGRAYSRAAVVEHLGGGDLHRVIELAHHALDLATRFGTDDIRAMQFLGIARCELGDLGGLDDLREAIRIALQRNDPLTGTAYVNLANQVWDFEGPAPALAVYQDSIRYGERRGLAGVIWARAETTWVLLDSGRFDDVLTTADELLVQDAGDTQIPSLVLPSKVRVLTLRGRLDEAAAAIPDMLARARAIGDPQVLLPALAAAATTAAALGDAAEAETLVKEFETASDRTVWWRAAFLPPVSRARADVGHVDMARSLVDTTEARTRMPVIARGAARAAIDETADEHERALDGYARAAAEWEAWGNVPETAFALLGAGRCLVTLGAPDRARAELWRARHIFARLGAGRALEETDQWLTRATALSS
jgi:class 3 adenylate cyclase/tetratricopeptide (TPR) repeat protein